MCSKHIKNDENLFFIILDFPFERIWRIMLKSGCSSTGNLCSNRPESACLLSVGKVTAV